jgi:FixJ family two-component response regulator
MAYTTVFVVSDDPAIQDSLSELVASAGLTPEIFPSLEVWLDAVQPERRGCLVLDARARDLTGPERLERFASVCARRPVLLLIDRGDVPVAVRAIKEGAVDVLEKPLRGDDLLERVKRAAATERGARATR